MNARHTFGLAALRGRILWCCLCFGVPDCVAQDEIPFIGVWPPRSLVLRGQESEPSESEETEVPDEEHIETDRDSFTPATTTAGRGRWIAEAAYSFIDNRHTFETHSFPESLLRYGVSERFELRLGWNYEVGGASDAVSGSSIGEINEGAKLEREHEISYGLKLSVTLIGYQAAFGIGGRGGGGGGFGGGGGGGARPAGGGGGARPV